MKKIFFGIAFIGLLMAAFFAGYWQSKVQITGSSIGGERTILHYIDPMNPGNRYDKPGIAPCGMALVPIYSDTGAASHSASMPSGTVMITPEKQQLIGVRIEQVQKASSSHAIRFLGKVAADETRIYQVNSSVAGLVRRVQPFSTGSLVKKGEPLAGFYAPEFLTAEQSYIYALNSPNLRSSVRIPGIQANVAEQSLKQIEDNLRFLGMGENQIRSLGRTRELIDTIDIEAPATGIILARNISPGLKFDKDAEFYRIADLREVWILLDTYGNEAKYFHPGGKVPVRYQGEAFEAVVSDVLPLFDPSTRTTKVRLVALNPEYVLRPDMFVDVEYLVAMPPALTVPVDAVLDSGLKKTVFVYRGDGFFEPRRVETGKYFNDRIEISKGLMEEEQIVIAGNFLIDSESRFKSPPIEEAGLTLIDPICGMLVNEKDARGLGLTTVVQDKTHFFCSKQCKEKFDNPPQNYPGSVEPVKFASDVHLSDTDSGHMDMSEHSHVEGQAKTLGHGGAGENHGGVVAPGESPADRKTLMLIELFDDSSKKPGMMPEAGPAEKEDGRMKTESKEETGTNQDFPPTEGRKVND